MRTKKVPAPARSDRFRLIVRKTAPDKPVAVSCCGGMLNQWVGVRFKDHEGNPLRLLEDVPS